MRIDVARLDFLLRRRLLLGYVVGMALYVFVIVAIYPQFKDSTSLNSLTQDSSTLAALFGISGSITSPGGWLNANIYANFFPLIALLLTIGYGAATIAGQDEDGTLCLLAVLPMRRSSIILQKAATMFLQSLALALAVAIVVLIGRSFDLAITPGHAVSISIATMLMSLDFGLIAMAVGAATGSRGVALGVGTAAAAIAYFVSSLAPVVHWIHSARYVSLLYWAVGNDQITRGVTLTDYLVLVAVGICVLGAAVLAFRRLDLR
jgi:ABC-2 type transport system permease protein